MRRLAITRRADVHRAVRLGTAVEAVALDRAREAATLGRADHVDDVAFLEGVALEDVPHHELGGGAEALFAQKALGRGAGLLEVAELRLGDEAIRLVFKAELNGVVAVLVLGADLRDHAGPCLDDRHAHKRAVVAEELRHPALASQDQRHDARNLLEKVPVRPGSPPQRSAPKTPGHAASGLKPEVDGLVRDRNNRRARHTTTGVPAAASWVRDSGLRALQVGRTHRQVGATPTRCRIPSLAISSRERTRNALAAVRP